MYRKNSTVTQLGRRNPSAAQGSIVVAFKKTSLTQRNVPHHALHIVGSKIEIRLTCNMELRARMVFTVVLLLDIVFQLKLVIALAK